MLYRGTTPGALYKGAYKPGKLYKGTQLVAGYADVSKAAPASWDGTYDDVVGVAAQGRGKQQTYSGKNLLNPAPWETPAATEKYTIKYLPDEDCFVLNGAFETTADFATRIINIPLEAGARYIMRCDIVSGSFTSPNYAMFYLGGVGSLRNWVPCQFGQTAADAAPGDAATCGWFYLSGGTVCNNLKIKIQFEKSTAPTPYEPYVGGKPSPSPDYPQPLVAAEGALTASGRTGTTPTTVTLPVLRAIPGTDIRDTLAYIGGGQWQVTRNVGVTVVDGETVKFTENAGGWWQLPWHSSPGALHNTDGSNNVGLKIRANGSYEFFYTLPDWSAAVGIESVDELNTLCQATAMTIWYALATPTTETLTLGELPSYPVHTELAVSGDYPPDVTGTAKVGT